MRVVDAVWEKRNLGVRATEVTCEACDGKEELRAALAAVHTPYSVCKVPSGAVELLLCAQEQGYRMIELLIGLERSLKEVELPALYQRFAKDIAVREACAEETKQILALVEAGTIFSTDRIALDPYFGAQIAGRRYANWTRDLLQAGAHLCVGCYKDTPVAFGVNQDKEGGVSDAVLGGLLDPQAGRGLGFLSIYANTVFAERQGNRRMETHVSSNNPAILNLHNVLEYRVKSLQYVLVKHQ